MKSSGGHVTRLLESRGSIIEIAFLAVALALAIKLIAVAIADYLGSARVWVMFMIGVGLLLVAVAYLAARLLARRKASIKPRRRSVTTGAVPQNERTLE